MNAAELLGFGFALAVGETTWFEGLLLIGVYCCSRARLLFPLLVARYRQQQLRRAARRAAIIAVLYP